MRQPTSDTELNAPGRELTRLRRRCSAKPIIFLTGHGDIPMTVQAMKAGAVDFLTKPVRDQTLLDAIYTAIERDVANRAAAAASERSTRLYESLTSRELQVLRLVVRGALNKQIAFELGISEVTVKLHRGSMMRKMQATSLIRLLETWQSLPSRVRTMSSPGGS